VTGARVGRQFNKGFRELESIAGKVICSSVDALFKHTAWIQCALDGLGMTPQRALALQFKVGGKPPKPIHLLAHFARSSFGGAAQPRIHRLHVLQQGIKLPI
jgi:hypothetical protein